MTKKEKTAYIKDMQVKLSTERDKLPYWSRYAQDVVKYLAKRDITITTSQVYIAVNTGRGTRVHEIYKALKALVKKKEEEFEQI